MKWVIVQRARFTVFYIFLKKKTFLPNIQISRRARSRSRSPIFDVKFRWRCHHLSSHSETKSCWWVMTISNSLNSNIRTLLSLAPDYRDETFQSNPNIMPRYRSIQYQSTHNAAATCRKVASRSNEIIELDNNPLTNGQVHSAFNFGCCVADRPAFDNTEAGPFTFAKWICGIVDSTIKCWLNHYYECLCAPSTPTPTPKPRYKGLILVNPFKFKLFGLSINLCV